MTRAGAVLIGPAGVGKTSLARTAADRLASQFGRVDWVTATAPAVPFAAFSHLIEVPDTGKTAAVLRAARESLGDGRLLIVDDAHLLDKLSAALVYQLAVSGAAKLIVTVAPNGPVADEISALWRDDLLARIDVEPPGHDDSRLATQVEEFVAALPGRGAPGAGVSGRRGSVCRSPTSPRLPGVTPSPSRGGGRRRHRRGRRASGAPAVRRRGPRRAGRTRAAPAAHRAGGSAGRLVARAASSTGCGWRCWRWTATARSRWPTWSRRPRRRCGWATWN